MVVRNPGISAFAIIAFALGIGANSAIFSVVNAVLILPLPYPEPDRVVLLREGRPRVGMEQGYVTFNELLEWKRRSQSFSQLAAMIYENTNLTGIDEPQRVAALKVSANFFDLLGVTPFLGRTFTPAEDQPGSEFVAILGNGFWRRQFGADAGITGKTITLNGRVHSVVGILPERFEFTSVDFDVFVPLSFSEESRGRRIHWLEVLGRLQPDQTLEQARAEMNLIANRMEKDLPDEYAGHSVYLAPLHYEMVREVRPKLMVLLGAVGFVLLIACANVANLLLARASARSTEIAVRIALGAGRARLIRQLLTESLVLSGAGGILGLAIAALALKALIAFIPADTPRLNLVGLSWNVIGFTLAISVATGLLFGLAPALRASGPAIISAIRAGGRGQTAGRRQQRLRNLLIVSEVALSLMLLAGAGLMTSGFIHLSRQDPGFRSANLLTMQMELTGPEVSNRVSRVAFYRQVLERLQSLPGVEGVATTTEHGVMMSSFVIEGVPVLLGAAPVADVRSISPAYFRVLGIPLLAGRDFTPADGASETAPLVAVVNQRMARRLWPNENAIGKRLSLVRPESSAIWMSVVGVVGDVKLRAEPADVIYVPYPQNPSSVLMLAIRAAQDPLRLAAAVRQELSQVSRNQPIHSIQTMEQVLAGRIASDRVTLVLLGAFACLAVVMAALGIYGVMSHSVTMRRHEIGIRIALGAQQADVLREFLRHALGLTLAGIGAGLVGAFAMRDVMASVLYGTSATDPTVLAGVSLLLMIIAMAASYFPARRATSVDPLVALRCE